MADPPAIDPRVTAAAAGDRRAAHDLLTELLPRIRNLIRYLIRRDQDVDDIAQEALIALARGFGTYRGEGKLTSWVDRVVVRVTFNHLKRARKHTDARTDLGPDLSLVPNSDEPPDRYAARRQRVAMLDRLPDDQRQALVLHFVLGMTVPEIGRELSVPDETVRSRLRLGKKKMRALEDDGGTDA